MTFPQLYIIGSAYQVTIHEFRKPDELPPFDVVMETIADMLDHALTPENGGSSEAGKAVIRQLAASVQQQFIQLEKSSGR